MPTEQIRDLYSRGVARFPKYLPLHSSMLRALMPRWGGSFEAVDQLIENAYAAAPADEGRATYARLYWYYAYREGDELDFFARTRASWDLVKEGFEDLRRLYPDSDYVLNGYAYMACRAEDWATFNRLALAVATRVSASAWTPKFSKRACEEKGRRIQDS